jgi:hypothetical protein
MNIQDQIEQAVKEHNNLELLSKLSTEVFVNIYMQYDNGSFGSEITDKLIDKSVNLADKIIHKSASKLSEK